MSLYLKYTGIPILVCIVILYLCCFIPVEDIPDISLEWTISFDKLVHFFMYFGLSGITAFNYIHLKRGKINMKKLLIGAFLIPIAYGGFIEILQNYFFSPRSGDLFDFIANSLGSLTALPFAILFKNYLIKNRFR